MTDEEIIAEFRAAEALLTGHFILTSGLRSGTYLQCARIMMDARRGERLCAVLAAKLRANSTSPFDIVASPAMGGVVVGYEMGRQLGVPAIFFERVDGQFTLRRGFTIEKGARVLMVEDVVTTGLSSRECLKAIAEEGGVPVAAVRRETADPPQQRRHVLAVDVLHREVRLPIGLAHVVHAAHVRVGHLPRQPHFLVKPCEPIGPSCECLGQELQRDRLPELQILGPVHLAHAAASDE
jgi:orotate phosphoribosyltransferase